MTWAEMTNYIESKKIILIALLLSVFVLASYLGVQENSFINYDDPAYVLENRHVKGGLSGEGLVWAFTASYLSNWHPLTWLSLMLDYDLSEMVNARQVVPKFTLDVKRKRVYSSTHDSIVCL